MTILQQDDDLNLNEYFQTHQLYDVYECLLTGLITVCPDEPLLWIFCGIQEIAHEGIENITWDKFVPADVKLRMKDVAESYLEEILRGKSLKPSAEMLTAAYEFYWTNLKRKYFTAIVRFYRVEKANRERRRRDNVKALRHFRQKCFRVYFKCWLEWKDFIKERTKHAVDILQSVALRAMCSLMLQQWHQVAHDDRVKREYFEKLESGEYDEEDDDDGLHAALDAKDSISKLPNKCVMRIFNFLDLLDIGHCASVCRAWRVLIGSSALWGSIDFAQIKSRLTDRFVLDCLIKYRAYVVHLNLRQCNNIGGPTLKAISECRNLQDLNLAECGRVNDDIMRRIIENCPALLYLNISRCSVTDWTLRLLTSHCTNLQYLCISCCTKLTDKGLLYFTFSRGCSKLIYLDISGCVNFTSSGINSIAQCCRNLQFIFINDIGSLNDDCIINLSRCFNIRSASILGSSHLSDAGLKALAFNKKIQKLRLESNFNITDYSFKCFGRCCLLLSHLYLVDCPMIGDASLRYLAHLRHLVVINLSDCVRITDAGVRHLAEGNSAPRVRELNLTNCVRISDFSMMRLAQRCHSLTHLSICFCERITDAGADLLTSLPSLIHFNLSATSVGDQGFHAIGSISTLQSVVASECSRISDIGVEKFSVQMRHLDAIDLSHCMELTDGAIRSLAFCCRRLTNINLSGCPLLSDLSVQYLSSVNKYIHILNLTGCVRLTDKAVQHLLNKCKQLSWLSLLYCKEVTKEAVKDAALHIAHVDYSDDPVPMWFNYNDHHRDAEVGGRRGRTLTSAA